ncbi:MAG: hypothetical protein IJA90_11385 [Peptococcaceae bacterium]|nr:hypothetical protein [Peptococcaceae bacterium]
MNTIHKSKKGVALFVLIMFLCTLMPVSAFAATDEYAVMPMAEGDGPSIDAFKYMKINSARAYYNASTCMMTDGMNWYYNDISLNDIGILSFAVQMTQPIDLKVYKANDEYCADESGKLKDNVQLGFPYEEQFCGEFVGYIEGYELAGLNYNFDEETRDEKKFNALISAIENGEREDLKDYYVNKRIKGYTKEEIPGGRSASEPVAMFALEDTEATTGSELAFEETAEITTEQALMLMAAAADDELEIRPIDFIHNQIAWKGIVVDENGENPQKLEPNQNYIIVLEPSTPSMNQYRSYLAIRVSDAPMDDVMRNKVEFGELHVVKTGDPVDLLTGALNWEYTDIAMYGDEDLPYTRYYNSTAIEDAYRLGYGWSDNYTYQVNMESLYAEVVFPGSQNMYFEMDYDGSYRSKPGSAFTFEKGGSGYVLTHKDGTVYDFNADGNIVSITKLNGDVTSFSYSGDKLSSVTTDTGTLTFSYSGDYVSSVTDGTGRSVTFQYDGDDLASAVNPDGDDLQYTYDDSHHLLTIQNFNGDVYLSNEYDDKDRVVEQYVEGEGNFYFTYDGESRVNTCTGENGYFQSIEYDVFYRIISDTTNDGTEYFTYNEKNERTSYTNRLGHTWQYGHDENGNVTSITYPNGATEFFDYDANNQLIAMTDRNGHTTSYDRDSRGNVIAATDGNGNTTRYEYNTMNLCVAATDALGNTTTYTYDSAGNMRSATDPLGHTTNYTYDNQGRMVSMTDALGHETRYEYSIAGKLLKVTDADGNELNYTVDGNGFNLSESDWMGNVTSYTYDTQNNLTSETSPMNHTTSYSYDKAGNLVGEVNALGYSSSYTYDSYGRMISYTDEDGYTWRYGYDSEGNLISVTDPLGGVTRTGYDNMEQVASETDANGNRTNYSYDAAGNLTAITDAQGGKLQYAYDANNNIVAATDKNGNTTRYAYDANNQLVKETDALGNVTNYEYDANGQLVKETTPLGNATSYQYDALGQIIAVTDPEGHTTQYTYDKLGRVITMTNADGTTVGYTYDANGQVLSITDEESYTICYVYDAEGKLVSVTNARGFVTSYDYDAVGNLVKTTDAMEGVESNTYDGRGNLTSTTNEEGYTTTYKYDGNGRLVSVTDPLGGVTALEYDKVGNITKITDAEGYTTVYNYDSLNRLTSYVDAEGYTFSFEYDAQGNTVAEIDGNGNKTKYQYDALNRAIVRINAEGNQAYVEYDADGRLVKAVDEEGAVTSYTYDKDGQLLSMTNAEGYTTTFAYDDMHRVVTMTDARGGVTAYEYNDRGEVTKIIDAEGYETSYTYDGNGNTTSMTTPDGVTSYEYDALDRLIKTTSPDGTVETYEYDKLGQMTAVTDKNGNRTQYVIDGNGNIVQTIDALGTVASFTYDKVGNLVKTDLHRIDKQDGVDEHQITLYSYDGRGLVTTVIDAANNQESYKYDGNGNLIEKTDKDGLVTRYAYSALDLVTNINYNGSKEVNYAYNKVGELVKMDDWLGTTTYELDLLNQLEKVTDHKGRTVEYTYDPVGNQSTVKYPDDTVVSYTYDLVQNMKTVTESNNGNVTSYDYDGMRRVVKQTYPNGWAVENEYDSMGRVVSIWDIDPSEKDLKTIKHTYSYDAYGNMLSEYKRGNGQGQAKEDWTYQYDALNRLVQAHETHGQYLRNYQYDSLGNLTYEWNDNNVIIDYKLNNLNQITTKTDDNWKTHTDYTYDSRGNTLQKIYYKNSKEIVMGAYEYDETNRMVKGTNDLGEQSIYHFNGLGMLATNEWLIKKNAYGYHDVAVSALTEVTAQDGSDSEIVLEEATGKAKVKSKKAAEEVAASPELNKTSHVVKDFVLDYNSYGQENLMEYELYDEGLTYRYVYGVDKLGVTAYTVPNGSASVTTAEGDLPLYYHMDHMGSSEFLTSDVTQRITSWTSYDEWGNITHNAVLKCGERELDLVKTYTGHERDSVLGMYYAKARMYDTADKHGSTKANKLGDKRFTAVDPVKGDVRNPQTMVQYTYVINNPLMYVDPLGEYYVQVEYNNRRDRKEYRIIPKDMLSSQVEGLIADKIPVVGEAIVGYALDKPLKNAGIVGGNSIMGIDGEQVVKNATAEFTSARLDAVDKYLKDSEVDTVLKHVGKLFVAVNVGYTIVKQTEIPMYDETVESLVGLLGYDLADVKFDSLSSVNNFMEKMYEFINEYNPYVTNQDAQTNGNTKKYFSQKGFRCLHYAENSYEGITYHFDTDLQAAKDEKNNTWKLFRINPKLVEGYEGRLQYVEKEVRKVWQNNLNGMYI